MREIMIGEGGVEQASKDTEKEEGIPEGYVSVKECHLPFLHHFPFPPLAFSCTCDNMEYSLWIQLVESIYVLF